MSNVIRNDTAKLAFSQRNSPQPCYRKGTQMLHIWHFQARESADMMQEQHNCGVATNIFALAFHGISRKA